MPRIATIAFIALWGSSAALLFGCGELTLSSDGSDSVSAASTAAPVIEATPTVEITSPEPGSFLIPGAVAIAGRVLPATGSTAEIVQVRLNGDLVAVAADGTFQGTYTATPGLNLLNAQVVDAAGSTGSTSVGVLAGEWRDASSPIFDGATARITDNALDGIAKLLEATVWGMDLTALLQGANPIFDTNLFVAQVGVNIDQIRFNDVQVILDTQPDGIHVDVRVIEPEIDVTVEAVLFGSTLSPTPATLIADDIRLTGRMTVIPRGDLSLDASTADVNLSFANFRVSATSQLISTIEPLVRGAVRKAIENAIQDAVTDTLEPLMDTKLLEILNPTTPLNVLGKEVLYDVRAHALSFDHDGLTLRTRLNCGAPNPIPAAVGREKSYITSGSHPPIGSAHGVWATVDDDAFNRLLYGFWAAGAVNLDLDQAFLDAEGVNLPIDLNLGALLEFLPELGNAGPADAPIGLQLRLGMPPIVEVTGAPDLAIGHIGEAMVGVTIDRGNGPELLLNAAVHASVGFSVELTQDGVSFTSASHPRLVFDVREEPIVELDNRKVELMLSIVLTPMIPQLLNNIDVLPIPHLQQLSIFNSHAYDDGPEHDHLTITGDMAR
ncbi:MAG: hypothetical protein ACYS22_09155 [Planctomycetota bacterium]|jgi:hypothetical protein